MNCRFERFGLRFHIGVTRTIPVRGVNSELKDGRHFLLFDIDEYDLEKVKHELRQLQKVHNLPTIYIMYTGVENHYHAYCFMACSMVEARTIIADTYIVDKVYLALGILRGYFTLRISPKPKREIKRAAVLRSAVADTADYREVKHFSWYDTKRW